MRIDRQHAERGGRSTHAGAQRDASHQYLRHGTQAVWNRLTKQLASRSGWFWRAWMASDGARRLINVGHHSRPLPVHVKTPQELARMHEDDSGSLAVEPAIKPRQ